LFPQEERCRHQSEACGKQTQNQQQQRQRHRVHELVNIIVVLVIVVAAVLRRGVTTTTATTHMIANDSRDPGAVSAVNGNTKRLSPSPGASLRIKLLGNPQTVTQVLKHVIY